MSKAVIISAGSIHDYEYAKAFIHEGDFVICADGGLSHARKMGITPDLTVGDFDSFDGEVNGENVIKLNCEKDYTDTHVAVCEALKSGYKEILLLGCSGTRLDHTLSNIGILEYILNFGGKGYMADEHNIIWIIEDKAVIKRRDGWHLSFIPIGKVWGVTMENLKYALNNYDLEFAQSIAVSNEFTEKDAVVYVEKGRLIAIMSRD